ncbi:MAG: hypothetical protein K2Y56_15535, partial [Methylobacterium sp.]|uniref:hypothetical protein n=1 Tax=Methylobacterium sp. TaxID=409 RepID=UPI0025CF7600
STSGRLTDGRSNSTPNFHLIDGHDPSRPIRLRSASCSRKRCPKLLDMIQLIPRSFQASFARITAPDILLEYISLQGPRDISNGVTRACT